MSLSDPIQRPAALDRRELLAAGLAGVALSALPSAAKAQSGARAPDAPRSGSATVAAHRIEVPMPHGGVTAGHPLGGGCARRLSRRLPCLDAPTPAATCAVAPFDDALGCCLRLRARRAGIWTAGGQG